MQYFDSEDKWNELLKRFEDDTAPNKGVLFENLVEKILLKLFPERKLKFTPTKETHDGSKDFWAIDSNNKKWWAECKNYTQNLSLKVLSPTLFMAELYDIDFLLFFSYSPLNNNLLRKIGIYSRRHGKRAFIYDDVNLENLIIQYFPDTVRDVIKSEPFSTEAHLYIKNFAEKHPKLYLAENFDGYYDINKGHELTVGEIYNIYCLVINRKSTTTNVTAKISGNDLEYYKLYGMANITISLENNELVMFSIKADLVKGKDGIKLPCISVNNRDFDADTTPNETEYTCKSGYYGPLVGRNFENIVSEIKTICTQPIYSGALIYGKGGCGKTRVLYETVRSLIACDYKILDFTGFDSGNNWADVIKEITYCVFSVSEDMVLDMLCTIETNMPFEFLDQNPENKSVYELLSAIKNNDEDRLANLYNILFEKLRNKKYALIIDNFQSYSPMLVDFFTRMINYFLNCSRNVDITLMFSINVDLIYNSTFTEFIGNFMSLSGNNISSAFYCKEISGFNNVKQAMVFLGSRLKLSEFPQFKQVKSTLESKRLLNPKHLEQIADYLITQGCVVIRDGKGFVPDIAHLIQCLNTVPPEYKLLFKINFGRFLELHKSQAEDFKMIFAVIYLFERIENKHIKAFELNVESINLLCSQGILINNGSLQVPSYSVEHDLSFECLTTVIYNDLLLTVSKSVAKLQPINICSLKFPPCYTELCMLACGILDYNELAKLNPHHIDELQNRHKLPFAQLFLDACLRYLDDNPSLMLSNITIICNYINDHIGVKTGEEYYQRAYSQVKNMKHDDPKVLKELFSFYIHDAENKMHLSKNHDVLGLYEEFTNIIDHIVYSNDDLKEKLLYARAYIQNRMFVCGKIENDPCKRINLLHASQKTCKVYGFWDVQFENYFDEAYLYLSAPDKKQKLLSALQNGFDAFKKTTLQQKKKFMTNFLSKKLLYICIAQDFQRALSLSESALEYIQKNNDINYHLFFKKRYMKYKLICLIALNKAEKADELLRQLSVIDDLSGNTDKFEIMYYYFIYFFCQKNQHQAKAYFEEMYNYAAENPAHSEKYICILTDCAIKLRSFNRSMAITVSQNDSYPSSFSSVDRILVANAKELSKIRKGFKTTAAISTKENINFYY